MTMPMNSSRHARPRRVSRSESSARDQHHLKAVNQAAPDEASLYIVHQNGYLQQRQRNRQPILPVRRPAPLEFMDGSQNQRMRGRLEAVGDYDREDIRKNPTGRNQRPDQRLQEHRRRPFAHAVVFAVAVPAIGGNEHAQHRQGVSQHQRKQQRASVEVHGVRSMLCAFKYIAPAAFCAHAASGSKRCICARTSDNSFSASSVS